MAWFQKTITIKANSRGCHLITQDIVNAMKEELKQINIGLATLFIQHTSASLTINENCDPDVRGDLENALNRIVPESWNKDMFKHTNEGPDDMPAHVKSSLMGASVTVPVTKGNFNLGTWQGIYLNEHRNVGGYGSGHSRKIVVTLQGQFMKDVIKNDL